MSLSRMLSFALALGAAATTPALASPAGKYDGAWSVSITTDKGSCDASSFTVIVAGNRLLRVQELPVSASGAIDAHGAAHFQVASMVDAAGTMLERTGSGRWSAPSRDCSGRWRAARL